MTKTLDAHLKEDGLILAPGAYDALSARIARQAGAGQGAGAAAVLIDGATGGGLR